MILSRDWATVLTWILAVRSLSYGGHGLQTAAQCHSFICVCWVRFRDWRTPRVSRSYCLQTGSSEETADSEVSRYFRSWLLKQCSELLSLTSGVPSCSWCGGSPGCLSHPTSRLHKASGSTCSLSFFPFRFVLYSTLSPSLIFPAWNSACFACEPLFLPAGCRPGWQARGALLCSSTSFSHFLFSLL